MSDKNSTIRSLTDEEKATLHPDAVSILECWDDGRKAFISGKSATLELESAEGMTPFYLFDEDSGYWRTEYYGIEYEVRKEEPGKLFAVERSCDSDGNSEYVEEADMTPGSKEYASLLKDCSWKEANKTYKEYAQWVIENNSDPLGNYYLCTFCKNTWASKDYEFLAELSGDTVTVKGYRYKGRKKWRNLSTASKAVKEYLDVDETGVARGCTPEELKKGQERLRPTVEGWVWSDTLVEKTLNLNGYIKELHAAARRTLKVEG